MKRQQSEGKVITSLSFWGVIISFDLQLVSLGAGGSYERRFVAVAISFCPERFVKCFWNLPTR